MFTNPYMNPFISQFPYMDAHELNLDWIIKAVKKVYTDMQEFEAANTVEYRGLWNITAQYTKNSIVLDNITGYLMIAKQPVPVGSDITNTDYWMLVSPFKIDTAFDEDSYNAIANKTVTDKFNSIDAEIVELHNTDDSLNQGIYNEIEARESADQALSDRIDTTNSDLSALSDSLDTTNSNLATETNIRAAADTTINARIDSLASLTEGSTTGDAELQDIRVSENGYTFPSAGDAVRNQFVNINNMLSGALGENNIINEAESMYVGDSGQTYLQKEFFIYDGSISLNDYFTFSVSSITGATASKPIRLALLDSSNNQIRYASADTTCYIQISASDISANVAKVKAFVYASTSTATSQNCSVQDPCFYTGLSKIFTYSDAFKSEVNSMIDTKRNPLIDITLGSLSNNYVNTIYGTITPADSYRMTDYIHVKGSKIYVVATTTASNVGVGFYDDAKRFISGADFDAYSVGDIVELTIPENAYYILYSGLATNASLMRMYIEKIADAVIDDDINPCNWNRSQECRTFKKILCIGDSLTEGRFDYTDGGITKEFTDLDLAYPAILKAITGRDTTNAGDAGETTVSWYAAHSSDDLSGHDACIIQLGRNDYAGDNNVSSEDRIQAMNNIITKVKTENPQIKIFISTQINYYNYTGVSTINSDMATVVSNNTDCYLLDIYNNGNMVKKDDSYSHCTAVGYQLLAEYYFRYISYIMHNNYSDFKNVQFIGTNRSYTT